MDLPGLPSVNEVTNLADNWCHDHLPFEHYGYRTAVYNYAAAAYLAGYEQAYQDVKDSLA